MHVLGLGGTREHTRGGRADVWATQPDTARSIDQGRLDHRGLTDFKEHRDVAEGRITWRTANLCPLPAPSLVSKVHPSALRHSTPRSTVSCPTKQVCHGHDHDRGHASTCNFTVYDCESLGPAHVQVRAMKGHRLRFMPAAIDVSSWPFRANLPR